MEYSENSKKTCKQCLLKKSLRDFSKNKARPDGNSTYCRSCTSQKNKESYGKHRSARLEKAQIYRDRYSGRIKYYQKSNRPKFAAHSAFYNRRKLEATPCWLTEAQREDIENIYKEAGRLTKETGVKHEVDHVVPIRGKNVCGLHVPWNLQILSKTENISKGNREWPDMW